MGLRARLVGGHVLTATAPAKVNLFLGVGSLRADGYHGVTTVLHALELADTLEVTPSAGLTLTCEPDVGIPAEQNLAYRAARAMAEAFGREADVELTLGKHIPHGAGLGGGSSDAAAVVATLATMWGEDPLGSVSLRVAAALGADVPFFLGRSGTALMTGRGDEFERELSGIAGTPVVLVRPSDPASTAAAYSAFDAAPRQAGDPEAVIVALQTCDLAALAVALDNNLEIAAVSVVPAIADALAWLRSASGVLGAAVAGSGSTVFGLCASDESAARVARAAQGRGWWSTSTRLGARGVEVSTAGGVR